MQCDAIRGQSRGGDVDCSNVGNSGERGRRHRRRRSGSCGQLMLLLHSPDRLRASDMEVPDWGTAPEEDYPSLLASDNTPASDNARKKAKRKQKQQQEHLQHLMHVPVHVVSTSTLSGQAASKKQRTQQEPHMFQAKANAHRNQRKDSEASAATGSASQPVVGQAAKGKNRACSVTDISEAGVGDNDSLSTQVAAQPITSAQAGKVKGEKAITAPQASVASGSVLGGLKHSQAESQLPHTSSADAQPTAKKGKTPNAISSKLTAGNCAPGNTQALSVPATQQAADTPAAGEHRPDATAAKGKQKKLGRNARLRLKRQAHRQQALLSSTTNPETTAEAATAQPAAHLSKKSKAARAESLPAITHGKSSGEQGSVAQAVSVNGSQMATLAKPAGSNGKQGQKLAASAASPTRSAEKADSLPAAKLKKSGLLEQMRSKLSGGRFRMLNEQLYTTEGQHAFHMMQAQPDLYQQYHEGFREQTQHWPVQPIDLAIAWLKKKSPTWVVADFGCGDARLGSSVPQAVHSLDLVATVPGVTACNMAHTRLESASIDAAIFCLALMGTDYGTFLKEAFRVLRPGGLLWVAEVRSRFIKSTSSSDALSTFFEALKQQGLYVTRQDSSNKMFVVVEAKKVAERCDVTVQWPDLKPCLYKRR